jgi:hypothetical protein
MVCYDCGELGHLQSHFLDRQLQGSGKRIDEDTSTEKSSGKLHGKRKFESINQDDSAAGISKSNRSPHSSYR